MLFDRLLNRSVEISGSEGVLSKTVWRRDFNDSHNNDVLSTGLLFDKECYASPTKLLDAVFTFLKPEIEFLSQTSECVYCNKNYVKKKNIGNWECSYHPISGSDFQCFACCGAPKTSFGWTGCVPCDHSSILPQDRIRWTKDNITVDVPLVILDEWTVKPASIEKIVEHDTDIARSFATIKRIGKRNR